MTINIEYESDIVLDFDYKEITNKVVAKALELETCPFDIELNVILTNNDSIKEINNSFRNLDLPTDVLSFPMIEYEYPGDFSALEEGSMEHFNPETGELVLGDIIISVDKLIGQAKEYGHSQTRELAFLIAHSMLHLFGYDHEDESQDNERLLMEDKQKRILEELQIGR